MVCELPEKMRQVLHKSTIAMLPDSLPLERVWARDYSVPILTYGSRPFLYAKRAHFPSVYYARDFTRAVNLYAHVCN